MTQDVQLLTTGEAAAKLQVSDETVRRWCADGKLAAIEMPSGRWRIRADVIDAILAGTTTAQARAA